MVRLSALRTDRIYPQEIPPGTHFCQRLSHSQCHSAAGRIRSIGNRTRELQPWGCLNKPPLRAPNTTSPSHILDSSLDFQQYLYQLHSLLLTDVMFTSLIQKLYLEMSHFQTALLSYRFVSHCEGPVVKQG